MVVIDDFEDGDMVEYDGNGVGTGSGAQTSVVREGTYALEVVNQGGTDSTYVSQSGLNHYYTQGERARVWVRTGSSGSSQPRVGIFWQGTSGPANQGTGEGYVFDIDPVDGEARVVKSEGSSVTTLASFTDPFANDTWYEYEIETDQSGFISFSVYDTNGSLVGSVGTTDTDYTSGGICFSHSGANTDGVGCYFDSFHTVEVSGTSIDISGISGITIDGTDVTEVTMDGDVVYSAGPSNVLEDVEWGDTDTVADHYDRHTSSYEAQSTTALESTYSIECTSAWSSIGHSTASLSDRSSAYEYVCRVRPGASDARPAFLVHSQDPSFPRSNCYYIAAFTDSNEIMLRELNDGSVTTHDTASVTINSGTTYDIRFAGDGNGNITGALHDIDGLSYGTELATVSATDTTHSGGTFGFYTLSNVPVYYDWVREP